MNYMEYPEFGVLAQEFVEATSPLVSNRTLNIMDIEGRIIASTDRTRIGTIHEGAQEAIRTGKTVVITTENESRYKGARPGYNLPLIENGEVLGAIGLYGTDQSASEAANLLQVYVSQFFKQHAIYREREFQNRVINQLLDSYLLGNGEKEETLQLAGVISYKLKFPLLVVGISQSVVSKDVMGDFYNRLISLVQPAKGTERKYLIGVRGRNVVLLHPLSAPLAKKLLYGVKMEQGSLAREPILSSLIDLVLEEDCRMTIGHICWTEEEIPESYREVLDLMKWSKGSVVCLENDREEIPYLYHRILRHGGIRAMAHYERVLAHKLTKRQKETLFSTVKVYFDNDRSIEKGASRLSIHKNTLLYRLNRIYELLGMEGMMPFEKEFLLRLLMTVNEEEKGE